MGKSFSLDLRKRVLKYLKTHSYRKTADVFNTWLERLLLPRLEKGTTVVMDNASYFFNSPSKNIDLFCFSHFGYHFNLKVIDKVF